MKQTALVQFAIVLMSLLPLATFAQREQEQIVMRYYGLKEEFGPKIEKWGLNPEHENIFKKELKKIYLEVLHGQALEKRIDIIENVSWFSGQGHFLFPDQPDSIISLSAETRIVKCVSIEKIILSPLINLSVWDIPWLYEQYNIIEPNKDSMRNMVRREPEKNRDIEIMSRIKTFFHLCRTETGWKINKIDKKILYSRASATGMGI